MSLLNTIHRSSSIALCAIRRSRAPPSTWSTRSTTQRHSVLIKAARQLVSLYATSNRRPGELAVAQQRNASSYTVSRSEAFSLSPEYFNGPKDPQDALNFEWDRLGQAIASTAARLEPRPPSNNLVSFEDEDRPEQDGDLEDTCDDVFESHDIFHGKNGEADDQQNTSHAKSMIDDKTLNPVRRAVQRLEALLNEAAPSHDHLIEVYNMLPEPRADSLSRSTTNKLLHVLSIVERRTPALAQRYMSVLDDMKQIGRHITDTQWNSAMSFVTKSSRRVTPCHVNAALQMWRDMESAAKAQHEARHQRSIEGNHAPSAYIHNAATFTILFDACIRAGNFVLAEMIHKEAAHRKIQLDRYYRTTRIYYYGLKRDGVGVRTAYRDLVEAGEFVDNTTISCLIAAFLASGEPAAAEQVFERSKRIHAMKTGQAATYGTSMHAVKTWQQRRELSAVLNASAKRARNNGLTDEERQQIHDQTPLAPSVNTYLAMIRYYAIVAGDIDRVTDLLSEMQTVGFDIPGAVFLYLFKAFTIHGGVLYTAWTRRRLEGMFSAFLTVFLQSRQGAPVSQSLSKNLTSGRVESSKSSAHAGTIADDVAGSFSPPQVNSLQDFEGLASLDITLDPNSLDDLVELDDNPFSTNHKDRSLNAASSSVVPESLPTTSSRATFTSSNPVVPPNSGSQIYFGPSLMRLCLAAFVKCASVDRAREVHEIILEHWASHASTDEGEVDSFEDLVPEYLRRADSGV